MKYRPGSFTKNFAWHGEGFRRLHEVVGAGFAARLEPVLQSTWRDRCGEERQDLQLIPLNFFLHQTRQTEGYVVSVDELVYHSIRRPHSLAYDRLALFAFHLNLAGDDARRRTGRSGWAPWANAFVREDLWSDDGGWQARRLQDEPLKQALREHIQAQSEEGLTKCFTNYRYFFGLAAYSESPTAYVNTAFDEWLSSALFLTWDRWQLEHPELQEVSAAELSGVVFDLEVHKLVGAPLQAVTDLSESLAETYIKHGALRRFGVDQERATVAGGDVAAAKKKKRRKKKPLRSKKSAAERLAGMSTVEADASVERTIKQYLAQNRDRTLAAAIKELYDDKCIFCESLLKIGHDPDVYYVEAAHLKPLGKPHLGPDKKENIIPLCPNHHLQFDRGMLRLVLRNGKYLIESKIAGDPLHGKSLVLREGHGLDEGCVEYHFQWFSVERSVD